MARGSILATTGILSLLALVLKLIYRHRLPALLKAQLTSAWQKFTLHVKLKILIGALRIDASASLSYAD